MESPIGCYEDQFNAKIPPNHKNTDGNDSRTLSRKVSCHGQADAEIAIEKISVYSSPREHMNEESCAQFDKLLYTDSWVKNQRSKVPSNFKPLASGYRDLGCPHGKYFAQRHARRLEIELGDRCIDIFHSCTDSEIDWEFYSVADSTTPEASVSQSAEFLIKRTDPYSASYQYVIASISEPILAEFARRRSECSDISQCYKNLESYADSLATSAMAEAMEKVTGISGKRNSEKDKGYNRAKRSISPAKSSQNTGTRWRITTKSNIDASPPNPHFKWPNQENYDGGTCSSRHLETLRERKKKCNSSRIPVPPKWKTQSVSDTRSERPDKTTIFHQSERHADSKKTSARGSPKAKLFKESVSNLEISPVLVSSAHPESCYRPGTNVYSNNIFTNQIQGTNTAEGHKPAEHTSGSSLPDNIIKSKCFSGEPLFNKTRKSPARVNKNTCNTQSPACTRWRLTTESNVERVKVPTDTQATPPVFSDTKLPGSELYEGDMCSDIMKAKNVLNTKQVANSRIPVTTKWKPQSNEPMLASPNGSDKSHFVFQQTEILNDRCLPAQSISNTNSHHSTVTGMEPSNERHFQQNNLLLHQFLPKWDDDLEETLARSRISPNNLRSYGATDYNQTNDMMEAPMFGNRQTPVFDDQGGWSSSPQMQHGMPNENRGSSPRMPPLLNMKHLYPDRRSREDSNGCSNSSQRYNVLTDVTTLPFYTTPDGYTSTLDDISSYHKPIEISEELIEPCKDLENCSKTSLESSTSE